MHERFLEELTLNAWPALDNLVYDGWILCFSGGYTRRANSIHPLYPSSLPTEQKIAECEATCAARGRETVFKITSSPHDADLDRLLDQLGYESAALTSVQTADLTRVEPADPTRLRTIDSVLGGPSDVAARSSTGDGVVISTTLDDTWFADFNRLTVVPEELQVSERQLLEKIVPPHAFASIAVDGQAVALGLAVSERGHVGLFDIIVDVHHRQRGLARILCTSLLRWGRDNGAKTAYLAVMADNAPALRLYQKLGFSELYTYYYRHRRPSG